MLSISAAVLLSSCETNAYIGTLISSCRTTSHVSRRPLYKVKPHHVLVCLLSLLVAFSYAYAQLVRTSAPVIAAACKLDAALHAVQCRDLVHLIEPPSAF
jgi:hypothetical protein